MSYSTKCCKTKLRNLPVLHRTVKRTIRNDTLLSLYFTIHTALNIRTYSSIKKLLQALLSSDVDTYNACHPVYTCLTILFKA